MTAANTQHAVALGVARKLTPSREILLWMTQSEAPKALQAPECNELLDDGYLVVESAQPPPKQPLCDGGCKLVLRLCIGESRSRRNSNSAISNKRDLESIAMPLDIGIR